MNNERERISCLRCGKTKDEPLSSGAERLFLFDTRYCLDCVEINLLEVALIEKHSPTVVQSGDWWLCAERQDLSCRWCGRAVRNILELGARRALFLDTQYCVDCAQLGVLGQSPEENAGPMFESVTAHNIARIAGRYNKATVDLAKIVIPEEVLNLVPWPREICEQLKLLPIQIVGNLLLVATCQPQICYNLEKFKSALPSALGLRVEYLVVTADALDAKLEDCCPEPEYVCEEVIHPELTK
jgi:hypothetical protein